MEKTIKDVAKLAGVSIATVSRYINNPEIVSNKSQIKIAKAIKDLEYVTNRVAKELRTNQTRIIGLIVPDINNAYYSSVIQNVEKVLESNDYISLLCTTSNSIEMEKKYISTLLEQKVAGIIFIGTRPIDSEQSSHILEIARKVPIVLVNENSFKGDFICIGNDESYGSYLATKYLSELGHERIGFLTSNRPFRTYQEKLKGYLQYFAEQNLEVIDEYIVKSNEEYEDAGFEGMSRLLRLKTPPTAIHTANDQMAIGAIWALLESGYMVPKDFSIIGYSNISTAKTVYPGITTLDQSGGDLGKLAAERLLNAISKNEKSFENIIIKPKLIKRNSCTVRKGE